MIKQALKAVAAFAAAALVAFPAFAHNLAMSVYPFGDTIEGEVYFSDGIFPSNALIEVFGPDGAKLGETRTDDAGYFTYAPTQGVDHRFFVDLGSGHVAESTVVTADFTIGGQPAAGAMPVADAALPAAGAVADAAAPAADDAPPPVNIGAPFGGVTLAEVQQAISSTLRAELRPLITELRLSQEAASFQSIIAGIGFIIGLVGVGFFFVARQQLKRPPGAAATGTPARAVPPGRLEAAE